MEGDSLQPLPYRMAPRKLDEYIGQEHIIGKGKMLRRMIEADRLSSIILFGPPGTGKSQTITNLIAIYYPHIVQGTMGTYTAIPYPTLGKTLRKTQIPIRDALWLNRSNFNLTAKDIATNCRHKKWISNTHLRPVIGIIAIRRQLGYLF